MRYHNITHDDLLNGAGLRTVLWVSGCEHHCHNCHNPVTWSIEDGLYFDEAAERELFESIARGYIDGVTFSGGDPLHLNNREDITALAKKIKQSHPNKTIWLYTGYLWEQIKDLEIINYLDVIVDGKYIEELNNTSLHWRGSSNQRIINVPLTLENDTIILFED